MLEGSGVHLMSLMDYPDFPDIIEDGNSFLGNALKKARVVSEWTGETVLADDSGLEVDALGGAPGVHSARYAGEDQRPPIGRDSGCMDQDSPATGQEVYQE